MEQQNGNTIVIIWDQDGTILKSKPRPERDNEFEKGKGQEWTTENGQRTLKGIIGSIQDINEVEYMDGIKEAMGECCNLPNMKVEQFIATNQPDLGRGIFPQKTSYNLNLQLIKYLPTIAILQHNEELQHNEGPQDNKELRPIIKNTFELY